MKKLFLISASFFAGMVVYAQNGSSGSQAINTQSGVITEPTINGKPYSQYKAEQEALKKQKAAPQATPDYTSSNTGFAKGVVQVPARQVPVQNKSDRTPEGGKPATSVESSVVTTENKQSKPTTSNAPEVPAQFRLPANTSWGNTAAAEKPVKAQVNDNTGQSVNSPVSTEVYKTPVIQEKPAASDLRQAEAKPVETKAKEVVTTVTKTPASARPDPNMGNGTNTPPAAVNTPKITYRSTTETPAKQQ